MTFDEIVSRYKEYRNLLSDFRDKVKANRLWYRQEQTELQGEMAKDPAGVPSSHSGHIFNAIQYKHADMMDSYPCANILPREPGDEDAAKVLTDVLPYVLERSGFKTVYSKNLYDKLICGTCAYGVFYNDRAETGRGEIEIKRIDLLNLTWQPDVDDLEESSCIFYDSFMSAEDFDVMYGEEDYPNIAVQSQYEELPECQTQDISETVVITDCYYKERKPDGKQILHFVKFSGNEVLFDSREKFKEGFYQHGMYPIVLDILHPVPGELYGFGLVDVGKDMQAHIDRLDWSINRNAYLLAKNRHFIQSNTGVNEEEFCDVSVDLVHINGTLDEYHTRRIDMGIMPDFVMEHRNRKIEELKEILGNRDFGQGGSNGGVTAASAITALQTAADKLVRDSVNTSYMAFTKIIRLVLELVREFYDEDRIFRVIGEDGKAVFYGVSSAGVFSRGEETVYDITITVEKNNPYQRGMHNQLIMELMQAGLLNPQNFPVASFVLKQLNFDGKDKLLRDLQEAYEGMQTQQVLGGEIPQSASQPAPFRQGGLDGALSEGGADPLVEIPIGDSGAAEVESFGAGGADPLVEIPIDGGE